MSEVRDPIDFELFKNAILSIADEMALTVLRTTYSGVLKDNMDYSTAICDADGQLVAQGLTLPGHLGSIPTALGAVMNHYGNEIQPGDIYILNDPFDGGMHLPDIFLFQPIYADDERVAFAATICHHTDVGGRVAGSNAADSTETYQEGLRIPPLKYYVAGKRDDAIHKMIEKNIRVPILVFGDMRAQLAACYTAEQGILELARIYGVNGVKYYLEELINYSERLSRIAIRDLPDGTYDFEDWIDDDGVDFGVPIRLKVTFTKKGETIKADFEGTDPQVKGAINNTLSFTKAVVYCGVKCVLPGDIPANEGFFRTVEVTAPKGSIANVVLPGASAARGLTGFRMNDLVLGALAKMCPDKVCASSDGGNVGVSVGGYYADRSPFIYVDFTSGSWGGRPFADGLEGNASIFANQSASSVEMTEREHPLEILAYEFVRDTSGAGRYRGGVAYRRDYRFTADEGVLQIRNDRHVFRPYGLCGGRPGGPSVNALNPGKKNGEVMTSKITRYIKKGDVFRYETAGSGGWGDALERETWRVARDIHNEIITAEVARRDYGVVIDAKTWTVDEAATAKLRDQMRAKRGWSGPPFVDRGPLPDGIVPET